MSVITNRKRRAGGVCFKKTVKIARSAPRPSFALPELLIAIQPRVNLAAGPEKREYSRPSVRGSSGNPGLKEIGAPRSAELHPSHPPTSVMTGRIA
jgi:hypothetical protein